MTAAPDSALLPALVAAEGALAPFAEFAPAEWQKLIPDDMLITQGSSLAKRQLTIGDLRRAREAHALIQAAIKQHNGEKV